MAVVFFTLSRDRCGIAPREVRHRNVGVSKTIDGCPSSLGIDISPDLGLKDDWEGSDSLKAREDADPMPEAGDAIPRDKRESTREARRGRIEGLRQIPSNVLTGARPVHITTRRPHLRHSLFTNLT